LSEDVDAVGADASPAHDARPGMVARLRRRLGRDDENGLVLVWMSVFLLVFLGFAALAVDIGHGWLVAQQAQNAADAAALGGVIYLPGNPANAMSTAQSISTANGFQNGVNGVVVTPAQQTTTSQLEVTVTKTVSTWFARALGFKTMTVSRSAYADYGGPPATPLDIVLIIDRTGSMSAADLANVKSAAGVLLTTFKPSLVSVALGVLGPSSTSSGCPGASNVHGIAGTPATWIAAPSPAAPLYNDYQNANGTLNANSVLVKTINCLNTSSVGTDLGTPVQQAQAYLAAKGRAGAGKGMILMTDGEANAGSAANQDCKYAATQAAAAKAAGITIVTIGFGIGGANCADAAAPAPSPYKTAAATQLLSDMASPVAGLPSVDNGCTAAENSDGDNFFCEPKTADLSAVFVQAGAALTGSQVRLIK
jgi:Flp pilus assembly protein TadG